MCGRFTLTPENVDYVMERLGVERDLVFEERYLPRYNIAPTDEHWIVTQENEARTIHHAGWGLVNWWDESRREGAKHINARAESLASRRPFREAFEHARCVVPADGFFEWVGEKDRRRPIWFHRPDREVFLFAGIYATARLKGEAGALTTFTIVTTTANEVMTPVHDRMPVILADDEQIDEWLYPGQTADRLKTLLRPPAEDFVVGTYVSSRVNSVKYDDPACLDEAEPESQGTLL